MPLSSAIFPKCVKQMRASLNASRNEIPSTLSGVLVKNHICTLVGVQHFDKGYKTTAGTEIGRRLLGTITLFPLNSAMVGIEEELASGKLPQFSTVKQASFEDIGKRFDYHIWILHPPRPELLGSSLSKKGFGRVSRPQVFSVIRNRICKPHVALN